MITITKAQFEQALEDGKRPDREMMYHIGDTTYIYFEDKWYKVE